MAAMIRESPAGQVIRWITGNRVLRYPEEIPGFELPEAWNSLLNASEKKHAPPVSSIRTPSRTATPTPMEGEGDFQDLEKEETIQERNRSGSDSSDPNNVELALTHTKSRLDTQPYSRDRFEVEEELAVEKTISKPVIPLKTSDGTVLVDWYTTDDSDNPQNWSNNKRFWIAFTINLYTFVVYCGSAIYTTAEYEVIGKFNLNPTEAALPLSLYVLGYGVGPLIFAPLSEIPAIGRSPVYFTTMVIFTILCVPTALVDNFAGLLVLRFLQGFFGSPCLANGAATMQDIYTLLYLPYALVAWVAAAYCGPALGPLLSGFAVMAKGWRWSLWEILWMAAPTLVVMFLFLPETSSHNILFRRAVRLRKLTGNSKLQSQSEIDQRMLKPSTVVVNALIKPIEICIKDPAIAFVNLYTALVYGIYYSFFEVFPLTYGTFYGFSIGMIGVVFTCVLVACIIGIAIYTSYLHFYLIPDIMKRGLRQQEHRLVPAIFASFGPVVGLFLFGWTARESIHWIVPTIGITIYAGSVFIILQCVFVYVPLSYPQYAASLFAGNDFVRSAMACGSILYARPLFINLGIGKGISVLAGLSTLGIIGMVALWVYGAKLRARSKFATA